MRTIPAVCSDGSRESTVQNKGITLGEAIQLFITSARRRPSRAWISWIRQFRSAWSDERSLASIGPDEVSAFLEARQKEGKSASTILSTLSTLRGVFKAGGLQCPIVQAVGKPDESRVRVLNDEENARLKAVMRPDDFAIVKLAAATGLRGSELWDLRRKDIKLGDGTVKVGMGPRARTVPVGPTALKILTKILATQRTQFVVVPFGHEHLTNRRTSFVVWMREVWRPCLREARIDDFRFQDLRHAFAAKMANAGKSQQAIALCLGLSLPSAKRYLHLYTSALNSAVAGI